MRPCNCPVNGVSKPLFGNRPMAPMQRQAVTPSTCSPRANLETIRFLTTRLTAEDRDIDVFMLNHLSVLDEETFPCTPACSTDPSTID